MTNVFVCLCALLQTRLEYSTSVVRCHADPYSVRQRLSGRLFDAKQGEKETRVALGEDDETFQVTRIIKGLGFKDWGLGFGVWSLGLRRSV